MNAQQESAEAKAKREAEEKAKRDAEAQQQKKPDKDAPRAKNEGREEFNERQGKGPSIGDLQGTGNSKKK
jgi:hypothetical protein